MKKLIHVFFNVLYPRHCPVCHRILRNQADLVCPECEDGFRRVGGHYCLKCGKPVKPQEEYCAECRGRKRSFDRNRSVFLYEGKLRQSLVRYKYYGAREYGDFYGVSICRYIGEEIRRWNPDVLIPIPLTSAKLRMRGFNQAGYMADRIGEKLEIPVSHDILKKIHETRSQKKLNAVQRKQNLKDAFYVKEDLRGFTVAVVDDVYTTGSTMEAAASCLKAAGAEKVYCITLCTGQG
ncbi:MAG: ComF family protein [Blautia sp.]|uniref:ComF family protein n=1 Tax=Blautia sp. TaxID=1955243 RepID=UPI002A751F4A|nr:ComF family protein [Blautia sp.]MDY3015750.1 ComF family protein [Blautia sp.]